MCEDHTDLQEVNRASFLTSVFEFQSHKLNAAQSTTAILIHEKDIIEMKASNYDMQIKCILMHANLLKFTFNVHH